MREYIVRLGFIITCVVAVGCSSPAADEDTGVSQDGGTPTMVIPTATPLPAITVTPEPTIIPSPTVNQQEIAIRQAFDDYREAVLSNDGEKILDMVDFNTILWYRNVLEDALTINRADLSNRDFMPKFTILSLRHQYTTAELETLTAEGLLLTAIEEGQFNEGTLESLEIHEVTIQGVDASLAFTDSPDLSIFFLKKEHDGWKVALWKIIAVSGPTLQQIIATSELSEDEYIVLALEAAFGNEVDEAIFEGPLE